MRHLIAVLKIFVFLILCLVTIPLQALSRALLGNTKFLYVIPHMFHNTTCAIFGVRRKVEGAFHDGKKVIFVGNHLSYIDIQKPFLSIDAPKPSPKRLKPSKSH